MNGILPGLASLSQTQAPPVGTTPEVPVNAATLGIPAPDCGPKASPVIGPDGQWICQEPQPQSSSWLLLLLGGYLLYHFWWSKPTRVTPAAVQRAERPERVENDGEDDYDDEEDDELDDE